MRVPRKVEVRVLIESDGETYGVLFRASENSSPAQIDHDLHAAMVSTLARITDLLGIPGWVLGKPAQLRRHTTP